MLRGSAVVMMPSGTHGNVTDRMRLRSRDAAKKFCCSGSTVPGQESRARVSFIHVVSVQGMNIFLFFINGILIIEHFLVNK